MCAIRGFQTAAVEAPYVGPSGPIYSLFTELLVFKLTKYFSTQADITVGLQTTKASFKKHANNQLHLIVILSVLFPWFKWASVKNRKDLNATSSCCPELQDRVFSSCSSLQLLSRPFCLMQTVDKLSSMSSFFTCDPFVRLRIFMFFLFISLFFNRCISNICWDSEWRCWCLAVRSSRSPEESVHVLLAAVPGPILRAHTEKKVFKMQ